MKKILSLFIIIISSFILSINVFAESTNTDVKIKLLDSKNEYISGVKFKIYKEDCSNSECNEINFINEFVTTDTYTYINNELESGLYTLVRVSDNFNISEKTVINIEDAVDEQVIIINEEVSDGIVIYNPLKDNTNTVYIYSSDGILVNSFNGDLDVFLVNLNEGNYYIVDALSKLYELHFSISNDKSLMVKYYDDYVIDSSIDLNKALVNNVENGNNDTTIDINTSTNENGTTSSTVTVGDITVENQVDVEVKVDWVSNVIDCPITSLSSTLKYIVGTIIFGFGIYLVIRNVKKYKSNN